MADSVTRRLLTRAARDRGYSISYIGPRNHFIIIDDNLGHSELFYGSRPMRSAANGASLVADKLLTLDFVRSLGFHVPEYHVCDELNQDAIDFYDNNMPIVVKPNDSEQSKGVTVGVENRDQLYAAFEYAQRYSPEGRVMLQKQLFGNLYRLFVLNGKLVAASLRQAAFVVGDGQSTVYELIVAKNADPRRSDDSSSPLKYIDLLKSSELLGAKINSILPVGEKLFVSAIASVSAGGEASDVTDVVDENLAKSIEKIAVELGLFVAGFDIICDDISSFTDNKYLALLEINSCPGLKIHMYPTAGGSPINLAEKILDECFTT